MSRYTSFLASSIDAFVKFRKASGRWNIVTYESNIRKFDKYCANYHSEADTLTQEIVDGWCKKRNNESNNSCRARISVIGTFVEYLRVRSLTNIVIATIKCPKTAGQE